MIGSRVYRGEVSQVLQDSRANSVDSSNLFNGGKGAVLLTVGDDGLSADGADTWQGFQLCLVGSVEIYKCVSGPGLAGFLTPNPPKEW